MFLADLDKREFGTGGGSDKFEQCRDGRLRLTDGRVRRQASVGDKVSERLSEIELHSRCEFRAWLYSARRPRRVRGRSDEN